MAICGGLDGGTSVTAICGGLDGGESVTAICGGLDGGESVMAICGGLDGGESVTAICGGLEGGESVNAKAELATTHPVTKAIRLTFIMIAPKVFSINAPMQVTKTRRPLLVKATHRAKFPHATVTMYA